VIVFLLVNSLFMWIIPSQDLNILERGYADLETLFVMAPWIFLFLIPAITMRVFSEEKKSGTIELLLVRPLSDMQVILAKYFAGVILVLVSLLPTLVYFFSVYQLGYPRGNMDMGGTWGSFIGLFFLAAIYVSIGVFSSSLTSNQVVAFIVSVLLSFIVFMGFESISSLAGTTTIESLLRNFGINEHYKSMSRGVIDSRDVIYFLGSITFFILLTKTVLESRKW
ncbi:MAG: gliding motility-associated ABC transporter permease subunit GldF, partial [Bacteroidota bacterium]